MKNYKEKELYFPLFFNIKGWTVLLAGAGTVASRRAELLTEFGAEVLVIAPEGTDKMEQLSRAGKLRWERRAFCMEDLEYTWRMVIAATDDTQLNREIADCCREKHILVNNAEDKTQCDFYFPGVAREDGIVIGVTTSGINHGQAKTIVRQLQLWLRRFAGSQE